MPSIEQLQTFIDAATLGSFSAAARQRGKTPSTVSEAISSLEIDLGLALFSRAGHTPILTEHGQALLTYAKAVQHAHREFVQYGLAAHAGMEARLTLAHSDVVPAGYLLPALSMLDQHFPSLIVEVLLPAENDIITLVSTGRAQLGFLKSSAEYPASIAHHPIDQIVFQPYIRQGHPLTRRSKLMLQDLQAVREVVIAPRAGRVPASLGPQCWLTESYWAALGMVEHGFGWTLLPEVFVREMNARAVQALQIDPPPAHWRGTIDAIWNPQHPPGKACSALIQLCQTGGMTTRPGSRSSRSTTPTTSTR